MINIKSLMVLCLSVFLSVGMVSEVDAKKRFGSGGFGKTFKSAPNKKSPSPFQQKKADKDSAGNQNNAVPAKNAAGAGAKGKGMMGGLMGGLLAGGIFAYLLGSGAFEGIQFMDILLLVVVAFIAFKLLKGFARPAPAAAGGYGSGAQTAQPREMPQEFKRSSVSQHSGSHDEQIPMNVPAGFNQGAFLEGALDHYRTLQAAWNKGDLDVVREYVAPELYAELHNQRQSMEIAPQTEILDLEAELVRADRTDSAYQLSILFRGRCKDEIEGSEDGIFDVWHLQKDVQQTDAPWVIIGIEAD